MPDKIKEQFELKSYNNNRPFLADITAPNASELLPTIIFAHGFKGFKDWGHFDFLADRFSEEGFAFLKFNMSYNGTTIDDPYNFGDLEAFSQNNITKELNDIDRMIDFIYSQAVEGVKFDTENLFLIGHSRGGGVSLIKAAEDDRIKGLSTWAALNDFKMGFNNDVVKEWQKNKLIYIDNARTNQKMPIHIQAYHDLESNKERYDPKIAMAKMSKSTLIIHGDNDQTVPLIQAYELKELNLESELHIVKDGNHVFGGTHPFNEQDLHPHACEVLNKTVSFFKNL